MLVADRRDRPSNKNPNTNAGITRHSSFVRTSLQIMDLNHFTNALKIIIKIKNNT